MFLQCVTSGGNYGTQAGCLQAAGVPDGQDSAARGGLSAECCLAARHAVQGRVLVLRALAGARLALVVALCLSLSLACVRPRKAHAIAFLPAIPAGLSLVDFVATVALPSIATAALGVTLAQMPDSGRDALAAAFIGNDAVASNREFMEDAYSQYQANGSFGVLGSNVPASVFTSVLDAVHSVDSARVVPFPASFVLQNAYGQRLLDALPSLSPSTSFSGALNPPLFLVYRLQQNTAGTYYIYVFSIIVSNYETNNFLSISVNPSFTSNRNLIRGSGSGAVSVFSTSVQVSTATGAYSLWDVWVNDYTSSISNVVNSMGSSFGTTSKSDYNNTSIPLPSTSSNSVIGSAYILPMSGLTTDGWHFAPSSITNTPGAVSNVYRDLVNGTYSVSQSVDLVRSELANQTIVFNDSISSYGDALLEAVEGGTDDVTGAIGETNTLLEGLPALIAAALHGDLGAIVTALNPLTLLSSILNALNPLTLLSDMWTALTVTIPQSLAGGWEIVTGIPSAIVLGITNGVSTVVTAVQGLGTLITDVPTAINGAISSAVSALEAALSALGISGLIEFVRQILAGVLSIPAAIASALGLDFAIDWADDLRPRLPEGPSSLVLPVATWSELVSVSTSLVALTPLGPLEGAINAAFSVMGGSGSAPRAPKYLIEFPKPGGGSWDFWVDFGEIPDNFFVVSHGVFYFVFAVWYVGFVRRFFKLADDLAMRVYGFATGGD